MASPTEAEVQSQIGKVILILDESYKYGNSNTKNLLSMYDGVIDTMETDYAAEVTAALDAYRSGFVSLMALGRSMVDPLLRTYAKQRGFPETDPIDILGRLYDAFVADSPDTTVKRRAFTFGSPAAGGSNVGTGTLHRLNSDKNNFDIENQTPDAKIVTCISDEHSGGTEHEEEFEMRGANRARDNLILTGSGAIGRIRALSARASFAFLGNPSFDDLDGTVASLTSIPNWTVGSSVSNFELDQTNYYRDYAGAGTSAALRIKTNDSVTQNFNIRSAQFDPFVPYYCQIAYNRQTYSGDGTLTLTLGSKTASVALAAQTGWNILRIAVGQNNWFSRWNQENPTLKIDLASNTTGDVLVDDVILAPFTFFDGGWYALVGSATPFLRDDTFTFTDSATEAGILQKWFNRLYRLYLPHAAAGAETWADPT